jgi:two-component system phosphate regulon response regulator PhoB
MAAQRVVLVEDEPDIAEVLRYNLEKEGLRVLVARRGDTALEAIRRDPPDLVLLDLMLPGLDGLELTRVLRRDAATARLPIVMLTARGEEVDRIVGLELGADDYVTKPFSPREVVLRVKAVLRRAAEAGDGDGREPGEVLRADGIELDVPAHRLHVRGEEVTLTATELRLLALLMRRAGRVQSRSRLLADVWGYADDVDSRTVDTHVRRLRRKLGPEADRIETLVGVGYRFQAAG